MHKNKKNGFTLVELLAVIVILAVILLIAAPKIQTVIESSRQSSIEATAKVIASNAEMIYANKKLLDKNYNGTITCSEVAKLSSDDYDLENCTIEIDTETGEATVTLAGKGAFEGYSCTGTSDSVTCTYGSTPEPIAYYAWMGNTDNALTAWTSTETNFKNVQTGYPDNDVFLRKQGDVLSACINNGGDKPLCVPKDLKKAESGFDWTEKEKEDALAKMKQIFGSEANCTADSNSVDCRLGDFYCYAYSVGSAHSYSNSSDLSCFVYSGGSVNCYLAD